MRERCRRQEAGGRISERLLLLIIFLLLAAYSLLVAGFVHAAEIASKAAVVMDSSTGRVLYGKNPNLKLLPASTAKLMTALVALDKLSLDDKVIISEKAAAISPVKANFRVGERVTVDTLLHAALIKSANDAAYALAEAAAGTEEKFVELMNQKAIALDMSDTRFINSTGLSGKGQYITAYDLSRMMRQALKHPAIKEIINIRTDRIYTEDGRKIFLKNSNRLLWADESVLGGKTGYTRKAKHCFVCASEQKGETIVVAILGAPRRETLWNESGGLIERGFAIMAGKEEPSVYFTRSDYGMSIKNASNDNRDKAIIKKASNKRNKKAMKAKARRNKSDKYANKNKAKNSTVAETNG